MFKKLFTISLILAFASLAFAQNTMLLRSNGEQIPLKGAKTLKEAIKTSKLTTSKGIAAKSYFPSATMNLTAAGELDTLEYHALGGNYNSNFGMFGQDIMLTWYKAHADMTLKAIGYALSDALGFDFVEPQFRIIKFNWTAEQLTAFAAATKQGYYPSIGDGFNEVDPFGEEATDNWVSENETNPLPPWTDNADPAANTFDYDLWSDGGFPWPASGSVVTESLNDPVYNWLELAGTGLGEADVLAGEIFAIVVYHPEARLSDNSGEDAAHRIGFGATEDYGVHDWKFYENGRGSDGADAGWWAREFTWDLVMAVDVTGDTPPSIGGVTNLPTTLSTEDRTVEAIITDGNPGGGAAGIASANLLYTIDGGSEVSAAMIANGDVYSGIIPGQQPGTVVSYSVEATDVGGNYSRYTLDYQYTIYEPTAGVTNLVVRNGFPSTSGYPQSYYFGTDTSYVYDKFIYDIWAYGALTKDLVDNYTNIFEITTTGPNDYHRDVVAEWLNVAGHNYLLCGDEWLGSDNSYTDQDYVAGSFEYDYLGLAHSYNDVSYDGGAGQALASKFMPIEGTQLGGPMFDLAAEIDAGDSTTIDSVLYDPAYEIEIDNWHDGFEVIDGVEVFMQAETRGIGGEAMVQDVNVGVSRVLENGNKVVFMSYDPLSINSTPTYYWFGQGEVSQTTQAVYWFEADVVGVEVDKTIPEAYELSQNYPNPFNPTTIITYSVPEKADITLKVFNLLGQEVTTLVSGTKNVGTHEVSFNATGLASGMYFYTIKAGQFTSTRKMMLIK